MTVMGSRQLLAVTMGLPMTRLLAAFREAASDTHTTATHPAPAA